MLKIKALSLIILCTLIITTALSAQATQHSDLYQAIDSLIHYQLRYIPAVDPAHDPDMQWDTLHPQRRRIIISRRTVPPKTAPPIILDGQLVGMDELDRLTMEQVRRLRVIAGKEPEAALYGEWGKQGMISISTDRPPPPPPPPPPPNRPKREMPFKLVPDMPRFPGCEDEGDKVAKEKCAKEKLFTYLRRHMDYPVEALQKGISGTVVATYVVRKDGVVTDVNIIRNIGGGCGKTVAQALEAMDKEGIRFTPRRARGRPVDIIFRLEVEFVDGRIEIGK